MNKNMGLLKKGAELLSFGLVAGILVAGCGGGGGSSGTGINAAAPSASNTALGSYILDSEGTGFLGNWATSSVSASATADTRSLAATASPTVFGITYVPKVLAQGTWKNVALAAGGGIELGPSGWVMGSQIGQTLTDSGDGTNAVLTEMNGVTYPFSLTKTSLAGQTIVCFTLPCAYPASYPAGAAIYTDTYTADHYFLLTTTNGYQITDQNGVAMTSLPTVDTTFCDPLLKYVYQEQSPALYPYTTNMYNAYYSSGGCSSTAITNTLANASTTFQFWVTVSVQPTGNLVVPNVIIMTNWYDPTAIRYFGLLNPVIYGYYNGYVWEGLQEPQGTTGSMKNKAAINAELAANGYAPIP